MKIEEQSPKNRKTYPSKLIQLIISLARPKKDELEALEYINLTCHNNPRDTTSGKYIIKVPRFDSSSPEDWIIFMDLV